LIERARGFVTDPLDSVTLDMLLASDAGRRGSPLESTALLAAAAGRVATAAPERAAELALWSIMTALGGRRVDPAVAAAGQFLAAVDTTGPQGRFAVTVVSGLQAVISGDPVTARAQFAAAAEQATCFTEGTMRTLTAFVGTFTGDYRRARTIIAVALADARRNGSLSGAVGMFPLLAIAQFGEGEVGAAVATVAEGLEMSERLGFVNDETGLIALRARISAVRGDEPGCRRLAETALRRSMAVDLAWAAEFARLALAELELGLGNPQAALEQLDQMHPGPVPPLTLLATGDIVDAALRAGDGARAEAAVDRLAAWAPVSPLSRVHGLVSRCRAVLADDPATAEHLFLDALQHHFTDAPILELARTRLAYGEWLRRERRRTDARVQLRAALDTFEGLGARLWADRARAELDATGEKARKRDVTTLDDLTPQELRIAHLVIDGASNREVAAQLFVSPKTVEYHLRKVYQKLGIGSRVELARAGVGSGAGDEGRH
jgi:ATP/maltotriose-dependent transcriptional regulator MalT